MTDQKISALLTLSLISSPLVATTNSTSTSTSSLEITSQRSSLRRMKHQLTSTPILQPMGEYVGQLQEKWQFPSDHLPIGMSLDDLHIASWNVLDEKYMGWVTEKDSQGLGRSLLVDEHVYINGTKLTVRDQHVADLVLHMISHPTHPRDIVSLQECSPAFIEELNSKLPPHVTLIAQAGRAVVINRNSFEIAEAQEIMGVFSAEPLRSVQKITLRRLDNGQTIQIVNAHVPGDPTKPGRFEFAQYLATLFDPAIPTIAMGDMNFNELEMAEAMKEGFSNQSPFSLYSPYCTNISPQIFTSKAIDHFFVYSPGSNIQLSAPNEVMFELEATASLLNPI